MNSKNNQNEINIGVDTGKTQLDIYIRPLDIYFTVTNDEKGINKAIKEINTSPNASSLKQQDDLNRHLLSPVQKKNYLLLSPILLTSKSSLVPSVN
jgi:hypothetical protein